MAKLERSINGNMNELLNRIESGILNGSMSAYLWKMPVILKVALLDVA